jgi:predicted 3-demethylubiquinone-9 3-methyltransferase (glyoxalase superfamily)
MYNELYYSLTTKYMNAISKNTICLWYDKGAEDAARFYADTFPDSMVKSVHNSIPCVGINGGSYFTQSEAFSFQIATEDQEETDRYWNAIVGNGGTESQCGWCKDRWGVSWQITPKTLTEAMSAGGAEAKRAFEAMMSMKKIDFSAIDAARRG